MRKVSFWLTRMIFVFMTLTAAAQKGKYPVTNFGPSDYQAGIQNIDFAQNRDMDIFVANNLGILSFNGVEWKRYAMNTGKKQRSLVFDETSNRLYVGSQGDFGYFDEEWTFHSLVPDIPEQSVNFDEVWSVYVLNDEVYFCTFQGIFVYNGSTIRVIRRDGGFNKSFLAGTRLFTQTPAGQLLELEGDRLVNSLPQNRMDDIVSGIIPYNQGHLLFYNSGAVEYSTPGGSEAVFPGLTAVLSGNYINHVAELSDSRVVVTTQRAGIFLFDPGTGEIENITVEDGLETNACLKTFQDFTGNLWVGMQNGVAIVDINSAARLINQDIGIEGSGYAAFRTDEGTYISTSNGIYFLPSGASGSIFLEGTEGPAYGMQMINGVLYGGHHTGLFILNGGRATRCAATDGLWQIRQLGSNPDYALAGTYSGLYVFQFNNEGILEPLHKIDGFNESSRFFEEDNSGRIWVGQFYKGLYELELTDDMKMAKASKVSDRAAGVPVDQHIILSRIDGSIYIGTEEGIYMLDEASGGIVEAENLNEAIGREWVYYLAEDGNKNIHVYTESKVGFFRPVSRGNYVYTPSSLFLLRNTFNNDLLNISVEMKNGILVNANEGFIHYDPAMENEPFLDKKPLITRVFSVADDSVLMAHAPFEKRPEAYGAIELSEGTKVLQFHVSPYNFSGGNDNRFRYVLEGFDQGYSDWTTATMKEYNNLKAGEYVFYAQSLNVVGEAVTSAPVHIVIVPPFYRSMWAMFVYILIGVGLIVLLYRIQKRRFRSKARKIEKDREEKLAKKQDELKELRDEQVKTELRHVNNLLAASTMNLVVKNEFIENIKEDIRSVKSKGGGETETRRALDRIIKDIDTTLKVQEDWKQFEHHFDRVHGDFLSRLTNRFTDLTPGEQKLCAFLRLKMDTKEIANLMGISIRGVEVARYRLRKKLDLDTNQNLSKFILEY